MYPLFTVRRGSSYIFFLRIISQIVIAKKNGGRDELGKFPAWAMHVKGMWKGEMLRIGAMARASEGRYHRAK